MISVTDLRKVYRARSGEVAALDGIDLHVAAGEIHGVVGRSGAGKSTLVRCLTAVERPTSGSVRIDGQELTSLGEAGRRRARRRIGMVFQHVNLLDNRSAAANVAFPLELAGVRRTARRARTAELLELVGLTDRARAYPAQLSGGQRQRVGIARALATDPAVLLCDEPTSALDVTTTRQILRLIKDVRDRLGVTVLLITHEPSVVKEVCDSVTLLRDGRVAEQGDLATVLTRQSSRLARDLLPILPPDQPGPFALLEVSFAGDHPAGGGEHRASLAFAQLVRHLDADVAVLGGAVETYGAQQFGRLRIGLPPTASVPDAVAFLRARGLTTEIVPGPTATEETTAETKEAATEETAWGRAER
ncbi:methionine ABC transporter ATP-binding protein [Parafrankia colletiae]|uniref:Methionine ABC transporter ATP-binding protein n=1 Tax=Parafrankia colletiae TaxID=573497 RepID=A0A1S1R010_9ACTN|nr:ATP-binding cassette domain-containing protein [Parafrankia colletiae]MCK9900249.1 ATP-binding cassette domain-containing protein [Frankia sp. Cpl3]OHV40288.1 methionine ABC transporter ATP-binding protein [Parafrankia colletiae]